MRCEDFPCCGHTAGDPCPTRDRRGRAIVRCVECGKRLNARAASSICSTCQRKMAGGDQDGTWDDSRYEGGA